MTRATIPAVLVFCVITLVLMPLTSAPRPSQERSGGQLSASPATTGASMATQPPTNGAAALGGVGSRTATPSVTPKSSLTPRRAEYATPRPTVAPTPSPRKEVPSQKPVSHSAKPPRRVQSVTSGVSGQATWYCIPGRSACTRGYSADCTCAAAGPELRVGNWRGRVVTVSTSRASVRVRLVDFCACPGNHVIDLFASTFSQLGPLSAGTIDVRVTW